MCVPDQMFFSTLTLALPEAPHALETVNATIKDGKNLLLLPPPPSLLKAIILQTLIIAQRSQKSSTFWPT